jgi:hypothetical protein
MKWFKIGFPVLVAVVALNVTVQGQEPEAAERKWKVQGGWVHQWGRGMDVSGPAPTLYKSVIPRSGSGSGGKLPPPSQAGDVGPEDGVPVVWNFKDGYVFRDEQSGVPPGGDPNNPLSTHYWHYENASQYNPANHTLTFHRDSGLQYAGGPSVKGDSSEEEFSSDGIEIKVSRLLHTWEEQAIDLDVVLGLAFFPDTETMRHKRSTVQNVSRVNETYVYRDYFGSPQGGGWQPPLDSYGPDYYGEFKTLPGDTDNPIIPLDYVGGSGNGSSAGVIRDTVEIKGRLWRLRGATGPMFTKPLTGRLSAYVAPQFALEFVDASVRRKEKVTYTDNRTGKTQEVASRSDSNSETDVLPGFLLTGGVDFRITERWYVGGSLGWEWLADDVTVDVGPDEASFDLDGGEFNLYLGCRF